VKKVAHGVAFAIFSGLAYLATGSLWGAFGLAIVYAGFDELHQAFIPSRTARFSDVVIDGVGALVGNAGIFLTQKFTTKRYVLNDVAQKTHVV
jgi:VanZ family protein